MALIDDIIAAATDDTVPIGTLLRKCLVLEQQVKNEKFKMWVNQELNGYEKIEDLPSYRTFAAVSYGIFLGMMGRQLTNQPLSLHVLNEQDRKLVATCPLMQPASAYEARPSKDSDAQLPWNPSLTVKYQQSFFPDSDMVLNRAWQLIPGSILVSLVETVRTNVLRFALDLKDQLRPETPTVDKLPSETVDRSVITNIYGGNILIAAHAENISQWSQTNIAEGDIRGLMAALTSLGVTPAGIAVLEKDIEADKQNGKPVLGSRVKGWLAKVGTYVGKEGVKTGVDIIQKLATKWVLQHYGVSV
jgi:hypothetical protein